MCRAWFLVVALLVVGSAAAEPPPVPAAVGRVNVQGQGFCTGTLVAERLVVTAAHCLFHPRTGRLAALADIHFVAGWDRGAYVAHGRPKAVHVDPAYDWTLRQEARGFAHDLAFLELADALPVAPLAVGGTLAEARSVVLMHYSRTRQHLAAVSLACRPLSRLGRLWRLDCPVESGASGAPVLVATRGGWQVAGIVIGRTETAAAVGSLALPLDAARAP